MITNNPDLNFEQAEKVLEVISDLEQKTEQFENMKFKSIKHPGFPVGGIFEQHQQSNTLHITVEKINNINYLEVLFNYFKFIYAFYLDKLPEDKTKNCKLSKSIVSPQIKEITNIKEESKVKVSDEFDEFDEISDDESFFEDEDDIQDMTGGGKTNSLRNPTPFS